MTLTPSNQAANRPSPWLTWLALLAFLLQGLLVQTHIHIASLPGLGPRPAASQAGAKNP